MRLRRTRRRQRSLAAAEDQSRHQHLGTNPCRDQMMTTAISAPTSRHQSLPRPNDDYGHLGTNILTSASSSAQVKVKIKHPSSTNTWRSYSTRPELVTKKNQPERIPNEEDIEDTIWKIFNGPEGDMRPLIESSRPNQDEPSCKSNCFGFSTHQRKTENWFHNQINFGSRVIDFTNRVNRSFPDLDIGALIGGFRSNQKEISYKSICYGILTQPGSSSNWNHINTGFGVEVIQLLNRMILSLPYLEAHGFRSLQTHIWRPGEYLLQSEASSITSRHLGESSISFPCTSIHRIRRIPLFSNLPYPEAFTLGAITHQRLVPFCCCVLETHSLNLDVPRHHSFTPKLSRLKHLTNFGHNPHKGSNGYKIKAASSLDHLPFNFVNIVSLFSVYDRLVLPLVEPI